MTSKKSLHPALKAGLAAALALTIAACGGGKNAPDEFSVVDRAPLVVPPEADLAPPRPGEPRAQEINPGRQAYEALFPNADFDKRKELSDGEVALLRELRSAGPDVRSNAGQVDLRVVKKTLLLPDLLDLGDVQYRPDNVRIMAGGETGR
ncbi:DUF3035 domain-containing protein [Yunchengibacter salinarum]|uniref:DUF3035 domain-containing protein n=1 Tax=Yunchengibacter salinarum TaxID=3133399 RepID=UPI0035B68D57